MKIQKSFENEDQACLYLVPTPIGNLEDITYRALETLKKVDLIAAEDTRNTQKLLNHFDISTSQISFHEHNKESRIPDLVDRLRQGQSIAQVSDAGMPSISDPGYELVAACLAADLPVLALPGPNAGLTALIASGIAPQRFFFQGFLSPKKKDMVEELEQLNFREETLIFYVSPYQLKTTLQAMVEVFGPQRPATLARELTKRFEEYIRGTLEEALTWTESTEIRGEFCLIVGGNPDAGELLQADYSEIPLKVHVQVLMEEDGLSSKAAIKEVAKRRDLPKREVYSAYHEL